MAQERKDGRSATMISLLQVANDWRATVDHVRTHGSRIIVAGSDATRPDLPTFVTPKAPAQLKAFLKTNPNGVQGPKRKVEWDPAGPSKSRKTCSRQRLPGPRGADDDDDDEVYNDDGVDDDIGFVAWEGLVSHFQRKCHD